MSEMLAAGVSNMKEPASAHAVEILPVAGDYNNSSSDTLVVNEGSTEQLSIPAIELASPKIGEELENQNVKSSVVRSLNLFFPGRF